MGKDAEQVCRALGGVARTHELLAAGVGPRALDGAVRSGRLLRIRQGVYACPDTPHGVCHAILHGGSLSCLSRLRSAGVWLLVDDERLHVALSPTAQDRLSACGCVVHWMPFEGAGVVGVVDALVHLLHCRGDEEFFVALESAMRKRLVRVRELARLRDRIPKRHRWLVGFARWNADSGLESLLRLRLKRLGVEVRSQVRIPGLSPVDFLLGARLILEVDGRANHDGPSKRHKDLVRDAVAAAQGFETLRFDYALVVHDWPKVEAAILARVSRRRR